MYHVHLTILYKLDFCLILYQATIFLGLSKFKAFADVAQHIKFAFPRVENIFKKRRKCWLPAFMSIFSFSNTVFKWLFPRGHHKLSLYGKGLIHMVSCSTKIISLPLFLLLKIHKAFVDSVGQDQTAQIMQSDL